MLQGVAGAVDNLWTLKPSKSANLTGDRYASLKWGAASVGVSNPYKFVVPVLIVHI